MQISNRFTIALHMLTLMEHFKSEKVTSDFMSQSIGVNPVIIRRILSQLQKSGIVTVKRGSGGAELTALAYDMTFLEVYKAIEVTPEKSLFKFHEQVNLNCPVGKMIHLLLDERLLEIQIQLEKALQDQKLKDLFQDEKKYIN